MRTPEVTPEVTPKIGDFPPKLGWAENFGGAQFPPKMRLKIFGGNFGEMAEISHFLSVQGGAMPSRARADYPFGIIITSGVRFGGPEGAPPEVTPKIGALASLRPNFGVRGSTSGVEARAHG